MTIEDALKIDQKWTLEQARNDIERYLLRDELPAYKAVALAITALDKQIPKKPLKKNPTCYSKSTDGAEHYAYDYYCSQCDAKVNSERHHCRCGQALDWSDNND